MAMPDTSLKILHINQVDFAHYKVRPDKIKATHIGID